MQTAAFFDFDHTLITVNSGTLWMKREWRLRRITLKQVMEASLYLLAYQFHTLDMDRVTVKALQTIKGEKEETVRQWINEWFSSDVVPYIAPQAQSVIEDHRTKGHLLVLLTSSSPYSSEAAMRYLGLDAFISTRYMVVDGVFTGDILQPSCYGQGKCILAEQFASQQQVDLKRSYFYTDSFSDLPMLEFVGHPRVVHPDLRLRLIAQSRSWPILDWRKPSC